MKLHSKLLTCLASFAIVGVAYAGSAISVSKMTSSFTEDDLELQDTWQGYYICPVALYPGEASGPAYLVKVTVDLDYRDEYKLPACPYKRTGYEFAGWRTFDACFFIGNYADGSVGTLAAGTRYNVCGCMELVATWRKVGSSSSIFGKAKTYNGVVYDGDEPVGTATFKTSKQAKNGSVKVSGAITLFNSKKKLTAKSLTVYPDEDYLWAELPVSGRGDVYLEMDEYEFYAEWEGYEIYAGDVGGNLYAGTHVFTADNAAVWDCGESTPIYKALWTDGNYCYSYLNTMFEDGQLFTVNGSRWTFAKAKTLKYTLSYNDYYYYYTHNASYSPAENYTGTKITYNAKTGVFTGSFNLLTGLDCLEGAYESRAEAMKYGAIFKKACKKYKMTVKGVVVNGVGYGSATCSKPAFSCWVRIE